MIVHWPGFVEEEAVRELTTPKFVGRALLDCPLAVCDRTAVILRPDLPEETSFAVFRRAVHAPSVAPMKWVYAIGPRLQTAGRMVEAGRLALRLGCCA